MKETKIMKKFAILGLLLLPFAVGCSSLCFWRSTTTEVAVLDEDLAPVTNVQVKGKLVGEYALVPREALENNPEPASPRPAAARKPATPAQDDKMRISWDGHSRIRLRCQQHFAAANVYPNRGFERYVDEENPPQVTIDGYIDPEVMGPIIEKVRKQNQAALAANPNLPQDELLMVCFNFHTPIGERYARHLTNDGKWAMVAPTSANPGGRVVLSGGVHIAGEVAKTADSDHEVGDRIHCYAVIPH